MAETETLAIGFVILAILAHYVTTGIALFRVGRVRQRQHILGISLPVTLLRPVCGIDQHDPETLASGLTLDPPASEVIFCCASPDDPAAALATALIARHPHPNGRLLLGDDAATSNPKLNNLIKGWRSARHDWIVISDSNVLMPADYLDQLFSAWRCDTGLVCSPPVGSRPEGFWAEIECAFLNTYQARWQLSADMVGFGFAQGKSMLWRRDVLERAGGILALGSEIAEDAAATNVVRQQRLRVRLVDRPFEQPLGYRSARQVCNRQLRWARLRRATFAQYFVPEVATGFVPPLVAAAYAVNGCDADALVSFAALFVAWYLPEALLNARAGWHFTAVTPLAWLARDLLIPAIWALAWAGRGFEWRGNAMSTALRMPVTAHHVQSAEITPSQ